MPGLNDEKIIFKPMTFEELCISFERLQRFNNPYNKFERVYRDILFKHLISPKISLKSYAELNLGTIKYLVRLIWNTSVEKISSGMSENNFINLYILYEEVKERSAKEILKKFVFSPNIAGYTKPANFCDSDFTSDIDVIKNIFEQNGISFDFDTGDLCFDDGFSEIYIKSGMNYPLNFDGFLQIARSFPETSANIKRLIKINDLIKKEKIFPGSGNIYNSLESLYKAAELYRKESSYKKPLKLVILAEGATEQILLPVFASIAGMDFDKNGIEIIDSGGKNHVEGIYSVLRNELNIPAVIILDSDAYENAEKIRKELRPGDTIHLISDGEFEDILLPDLICKAVNNYYGYTGKIKKTEINKPGRKTVLLSELWKQKGFGDFKKSEFARIIAEHVSSSSDLSEEIKKIILLIKEKLN